MNVMSMIRSAGRERNVKKALELLEALETASRLGRGLGAGPREAQSG